MPRVMDQVERKRRLRLKRLRLKQRLPALLPHIPSDLCIRDISTKLSFHTLCMLWSVNMGWQDAISSGQIHCAKLLSGCTEKLVVFNRILSNCNSLCISLFSLVTNTIHDLPLIPGVQTGIPQSCQCITLDSKVYVLGGVPGAQFSSPNVYLFDVATHGPWRQCASMLTPRSAFGAEVIDGKIFVCGGGSSSLAPVHETEVYDPNTDSWTTLAPMPSVRRNHKIAVWGGKVFVYGGVSRKSSGLIDIYDPIQNQWKLLVDKPFSTGHHTLFMLEGTLYSCLRNEVFAYNPLDNSWAFFKSFLYSNVESENERNKGLHWPIRTLFLDEDELMAFGPMIDQTGTLPSCLTRTVGLRSSNAKVLWQPARGPMTPHCCLDSPFIRTLRV